MKLAIVSPQFPFSGRVPLVPPILEYLAALTYRELPAADIQLIDANQRDITPEDIAGDTVAISAMTATAPWAYRFADDCRKIGKRVILGGIHPSALPDEAALHADSVVVGEAESVWGRVLADVKNGTLNQFYHGERQSLDTLPKPVKANLKGNYQFRAFFTMRGCPYRCTFCSVRRFFGDTIRYRPIASVVDEIESCAGKLWFNGDDNIWGGDIQRSINLFDALAQGTKKHWYGFGDLRSLQGADGAKMLASARKSGLFSVWAGWEGDEKNLGAFNATGKQGSNREATVKQMQDAGIDVTLFVVLGGRQDSIDSFKRTLELSERLQVGIHPVLLTPLPGTELYDQYREYLVPGLGWESFTGVNAVFEHPDPLMKPVRREEDYHRLSHELFRFERIINRIGNISSDGFPTSHIYSFMMQVPMKHALSKAYAEWQSEAGVKAHVKPVDNEMNASPDVARDTGYFANKGPTFWGASLVAMTIADVIEAYYLDSMFIDYLSIFLFLNSFLIIFGYVYLNRKLICRNIDILIDWSRDGRAKKALMKRQALMGTAIVAGEWWGYICSFQH
jgi:hypothetical protein